MTSGEWTCLISFATAPLTCSERGGSKIFKKIYICLQRDSNPHHASQRQESQRLRPLGHEGLMVISGLMSYRIMGYKSFKKNCYVTTHINLNMVTCVFELNVRLNFHFLSHCRF